MNKLISLSIKNKVILAGSMSLVITAALLFAPRASTPDLKAQVANCDNAPQVATLNPFSITYGTAGINCEDNPLITVRNVNSGAYSYVSDSSGQVGDEFYVRLYVHNGAAINFDPNQTTARNVNGNLSIHGGVILASASGSNTNTVSGSASIQIPSGAHLEIVSGSQEITNYQGSPANSGYINFSGSSANFGFGDMTACFEHSRFIRFKVRVVGEQVLNPTGSISANLDGQVEGQCLLYARINWNTQNAQNKQVQVKVRDITNNGAETLMYGAENGNERVNWIEPNHNYEFKLYADGQQLGNTAYVTGSNLNCGVTPTPTPTPVPQRTYSLNVSGVTCQQPFPIVTWITNGFLNQTEVHVISNGVDQVFSNFQEGGKVANFINPGQQYIFRLVDADVNNPQNNVNVYEINYTGQYLNCAIPTPTPVPTIIPTPTPTPNPTPVASICPAGSVSLSPSILNQGQTAIASAPYGWHGGWFVSSNTRLVTISGNSVIAGYSSIGSSTVTGEGWTAPNGATNCSLGWSAITVQREAVAACVNRNFNSNTSGIYANNNKVTSLNPSQNFTVSCDYGVVSGYITLEGNGATGCGFTGWNGTAAQFNCTAPAQNGSYSVACKMSNNVAADNSCSALNNAGYYTINSQPIPANFTATATATASATASAYCPNGTSASASASASATATATSFVSQSDAQNKAYNSAYSQAQVSAQANAQASASANCPVPPPACVINNNVNLSASLVTENGSGNYKTTISFSWNGNNPMRLVYIDPIDGQEKTLVSNAVNGGSYTFNSISANKNYIFKLYDTSSCGGVVSTVTVRKDVSQACVSNSNYALNIGYPVKQGSTYAVLVSWSSTGSNNVKISHNSLSNVIVTGNSTGQFPVTNLQPGSSHSFYMSDALCGSVLTSAIVHIPTEPTPTPTPTPTVTPTPVQTGNCNNSTNSCNNNTNNNNQSSTGDNSANQNNQSNINGNNNTVTQTNNNCVNNSCNTIFYIQNGSTVTQNEYRQLSIEKLVRHTNGGSYQNSVSANQNETVEFQIVVKNVGNQPVSNIKLSDVLPSGLSFVSGQINGELNLGTLYSNDSRTVTFQARVNSNFTNSIQNIARVSGDGVSQIQDDAWVFISQVQGGNVSLSYSKKAVNETKNANATAVNATREDFITYTLTVNNTGNAPANNFVITDDLSQVLPYADMVENGGGTLNGNVISYPGITIPAGGSVSKSFKVRVKYSLASNLTYTMVNTYGNTLTIRINNPQVLGTFVAPKTGADTIGITFSALLTLGFAAYKKRELFSKFILNN